MQQEYNVNYPPQHVVVTPDGEVLVRINGYAGTEDFLSYLDAAEGRYSGESA
jgi:thioredoxin-related protein